MRTIQLAWGSPALLLLLVSSLGGVGCGGSSSPSTEAPPSTSTPPAETPVANRAPSVEQVTASQASLDEGSSVTLAVSASDPDQQPLTYSWTQLPPFPAGLFGPETGGGSRTWTAPLLSRTTVFTLKVTASDGKGGTAQGSVSVTVANVPALNQAPIVDEAPTLPTTRVIAGETVPLFINARDRDGDPLTYAWKMTPRLVGTLTGAQSGMASWRSPDLSTATTYTFQVTVSDGTATVTRSASLRVEVPTYARDIQPLWSPACTDCHNDSPGSFGALNLLPDASYAQLVRHGTAGACGSLQRVSPGQPADSLLVLRLGDESCGRQMPQSDPGYFNRNPGQLTRLRSWILAGAHDD